MAEKNEDGIDLAGVITPQLIDEIFFEAIKALIRNNNAVLIDTEKCQEYKSRQNDCHGCESFLGCYKYIAIMRLVFLNPTTQEFDLILERIIKANSQEGIERLEADFMEID